MGHKELIQTFRDLEDLTKGKAPDEIHTTWTARHHDDLHMLLRSALGALYGVPTIDGVPVMMYPETPEHLFRTVQNYFTDSSLNLWAQETQEGDEWVENRRTKAGRYVLRFWVEDRPR